MSAAQTRKNGESELLLFTAAAESEKKKEISPSNKDGVGGAAICSPVSAAHGLVFSAV